MAETQCPMGLENRLRMRARRNKWVTHRLSLEPGQGWEGCSEQGGVCHWLIARSLHEIRVVYHESGGNLRA